MKPLSSYYTLAFMLHIIDRGPHPCGFIAAK